MTWPAFPHVAVVGSMTAATARLRGFHVDMVNESGDAEGLFDELMRTIESGAVCYPRSSLTLPPMPWGDVRIMSPIVYETTAIDFDRTIRERVDIAAVTSASAVRALGCVDVAMASIGRTTSNAIRKLGVEPRLEAHAPTFVALADAIAAHARSQSA
jgi:uroporphyrinogen-III synthase